MDIIVLFSSLKYYKIYFFYITFYYDITILRICIYTHKYNVYFHIIKISLCLYTLLRNV